MSRRQYIAFGVFVIAFLTMAWGVPPLAEREDMLPGILLGTGCTAVMIVCLITGHLVNVDADFDTASENVLEDKVMNNYDNFNNSGVVELSEIATMDSVAPFIGVEKAELEYLYKEVSILAGNSLAKVAEGDDREKSHEKALFKLLGIIKEQLDIRNAAEMRLLEAIKAVENENA